MAPEAAPKIAEGVPAKDADVVIDFFKSIGVSSQLTEQQSTKDFYSYLLRQFLKVDRIDRGKVSCTFAVESALANVYGGLHGGAVAAIAERVSIACARTVVSDDDKDLFLGELGISYLSAAPKDAEVNVEASVVRSGRNITVVTVDFKLQQTNKLVYLARSTFYTSPIAKL